ncbi:hypothetical protein ACFYXH_29575 [Streptomyces sp. NPDC002730]|uniref:hypothetical protein n=1 Tax=Streptomyces sp. NPDC002730 TaxID=3364662 RepID=UPI0036AAC45D
MHVHDEGPGAIRTRALVMSVADTDPVTAASLLDDGTELPGLRPVAIGGERLRLDAQVRLGRGLAPGARPISGYGPTEGAGCETSFEIGRLPGPVEDPARHACLGQPFPGGAAQIRKGQIWLTTPGSGDAVPTGDLGRQDGSGPLEFRGWMAHRVTVDG